MSSNQQDFLVDAYKFSSVGPKAYCPKPEEPKQASYLNTSSSVRTAGSRQPQNLSVFLTLSQLNGIRRSGRTKCH
jgi:hypothetical protein